MQKEMRRPETQTVAMMRFLYEQRLYDKKNVPLLEKSEWVPFKVHRTLTQPSSVCITSSIKGRLELCAPDSQLFSGECTVQRIS